MKFKNIFTLALLICAISAQAQTQYLRILENTDNQFRFERLQVIEYNDFSDTLVIARFPEKWLDSTELRQYQFALIGQRTERKQELTRLFQIEQSENDWLITSVDAIFGDGTFQNQQTARIYEFLQGDWTLLERNGDTKKTVVNIQGTAITVGDKTGVVSLSESLQVVVTGIFQTAFVMEIQQNGTLRGERTVSGRQVVYVLTR